MYTTIFWMGTMMRKAVDMDDFGGPPKSLETLKWSINDGYSMFLFS